LRVTIAAGKFHGVIPPRHSDRLFCDDDALVRPRARHGVALEPLCLLAEPLVKRGGVVAFHPRLAERLALLGHEQRGELVGVLLHQVGKPAEHSGLLLGGPVFPVRQRPLSRLDRTAGLGRAHPRHLCDGFAGSRIGNGE
jgi:hypothetical protein